MPKKMPTKRRRAARPAAAAAAVGARLESAWTLERYAALDRELEQLPDHRLLECFGTELWSRAISRRGEDKIVGRAARVVKALWIAVRARDRAADRATGALAREAKAYIDARDAETAALVAAGDRKIGWRDRWAGRELPPEKKLDQHENVAALLREAKGLRLIRDSRDPENLHMAADAVAGFLLVGLIQLFPNLEPGNYSEAATDLAAKLRRAAKKDAALRARSGMKEPAPLAGLTEKDIVRAGFAALGVKPADYNNWIGGAKKLAPPARRLT